LAPEREEVFTDPERNIESQGHKWRLGWKKANSFKQLGAKLEKSSFLKK